MTNRADREFYPSENVLRKALFTSMLEVLTFSEEGSGFVFFLQDFKGNTKKIFKVLAIFCGKGLSQIAGNTRIVLQSKRFKNDRTDGSTNIPNLASDRSFERRMIELIVRPIFSKIVRQEG